MKRLLTALPLRRYLNAGVLLAVSGGADSVAMLRFFVEARAMDFPGGKLAVAHVNHALRGAESDEDATFVEELARRFALDFHTKTIDPQEWTLDQSGSFESAARDIRYEFLQRTAEKIGFRHIAVAHTRDDQIETIMHRILRGTGIAGLAGMRRFRPLGDAVTIIRPLLDLRREELLAYLQRLEQDYRTDSSNTSPQWTRNKIRLELLPYLKREYNPALEDALEQLGRLAGEVQDVLDEQLERITETAIERLSPSSVTLRCGPLRREKPYVLREFLISLWKIQSWPLRAMGFEQWTALEELVRDDRESPKPIKRFFPGSIEALYNPTNDTLHISSPA